MTLSALCWCRRVYSLNLVAKKPLSWVAEPCMGRVEVRVRVNVFRIILIIYVNIVPVIGFLRSMSSPT